MSDTQQISLTTEEAAALKRALSILTEKFWTPETCNHPYQSLNALTGRVYCLECDVTLPGRRRDNG